MPMGKWPMQGLMGRAALEPHPQCDGRLHHVVLLAERSARAACLLALPPIRCSGLPSRPPSDWLSSSSLIWRAALTPSLS